MKDSADEIRKSLGAKNLIIGTDRTMSKLKLGKLQKVFITLNSPGDIKDSIKYYAKMTKTEVTELDYSNDELGTLCKKSFSISVAGLLKV